MEQLSVVAEEFLSDATLRRLSGRDELEAVRYLEMTADTSEQTLGDLGRRLPALEELRLSGSNISTLRDLGTALDGLQVLWIARSSLVELEGFGAFLNLRELFAAFNDVVDLSPISGAERLQVLDLEGNAIDDPSQVLYLQECPELSSLNLQDNGIEAAVGAAIAEALRSEHCKLTSLNLCHNDLGAAVSSRLETLVPWVEL